MKSCSVKFFTLYIANRYLLLVRCLKSCIWRNFKFCWILWYFAKLIVSSLQTLLAPLLPSPVPISTVCLQDGAAMGTMIVLIIAMNTTVQHECLGRALPISLPVPTTAASLIPGVVTLITTVGTAQMKLTAVSIAVKNISLKYYYMEIWYRKTINIILEKKGW